MTENTEAEQGPAPSPPLERPRGLRRRRRWLAAVVVAAVAAAAAVVVVWVMSKRGALDCATARRTEPPGRGIEICRAEYDDNHDPATAIHLADLLRKTGDRVAAKAYATQLLATRMRADALQILGKIAVAEGRLDDATNALELARGLHRADGQSGPLAGDDQALANVQTMRYKFAEALLSLDECLVEARAGADATIEFYCHVAAARVLMTVGMLDLAKLELDRAVPSTDADRVRKEFEQGNLHQENERDPRHEQQHESAISHFEAALALDERAQVPGMSLAACLSIVYSLAELKRFDDAGRFLARARTLDPQTTSTRQQAFLAARIAYRRGDAVLAASLGDQVYAGSTDPDYRLSIAVMQARIALARGDLAGAEKWALLGIEDVEAVRRTQSAAELRPWVLSTRRDPYELLFVTQARAGRTEDALVALDRWMGRTQLDAMARPSQAVSLDLRGVSTRIQKLGTWLPAVSAALEGAPADRRAVLETLRATDLLALVIANEEVWCVTSNRGAVRITSLGPSDALDARFADLRARPTDKELSNQLGELVLRDGVARATRDPLHVLLDGRLATLPVAALRLHGRPLIAVRPMVRIQRLIDRPCLAAPARSTTVVLADAQSDLPDARAEATEVAGLLGATAAVGRDATSNALFAASDAAVLHVAVHANGDTGGGVLLMYDQPVSAPEIVARHLGPPLVVLSDCASAASEDGEVSGSLASAFLAAGSTRVLASLRPVSDPGAREIAVRFYRAGGVADPVRALAQVQAELAETANHDWPNVAVFGHDVCQRRSGG